MNVIFDIDGTLAKVGARLECLMREPKNWEEFYRRCGEDLPNVPVVRTYQALVTCEADHRIVLLTGRGEDNRELTQRWLAAHNVWGYEALLMRPVGDHRPDVQVKPEVLAAYGFKPDLVFEDRQGMVDYWRSVGVPCFQVAKGDY